MAKYTSQQSVNSGVPLGGIGAGKIEIMPSGVIDNMTIFNNYHAPLTGNRDSGQGVLGFHFGLFTCARKKRYVTLLQAASLAHYPTVEEIHYNGEFPFAYLEYKDRQLPIRISLEAFSSFIPHDENNSCIPAAFFCFKLRNPLSYAVDVSLLVAIRNIVSSWCVGRFNQVIEESGMVSLTCHSRRPQPLDVAQGSMSLVVPKTKKYDISYLGEYNLAMHPFSFTKDTVSLEAFDLFAKDGILPYKNSEVPVASEGVELGGALAVRAKLGARATLKIPVFLTWHMPVCHDGHVYSNHFRNAREVARYVVSHVDELHKKTSEFVDSVKGITAPAWLHDALLNNLYTFFSSTIWTKRNTFAFLESPQVCPLAGTLDVRFYSSIALALLFPKLETKELLQFAEAQRPEGYVNHDLGRMRLDAPSVSTNRLFWKDLNSKFILMSYRDYLWTKDDAQLKKLYPFIKKAFYWLLDSDKNKDYLPDSEGADHTFDLWECYGVSSYTASIFLAAALALQKIAEIAEDKETAQTASEYAKKGKYSFEKKLWNKTYFIEYNNRNSRNSKGMPKLSTSCTVGQLAGQWYAHLLGLGYIVSKDRVRKAVKTILALNAQDSPFGMTNSVFADGSRNACNSHAANIWIGLNYSFLSLAIFEGFTKEAMDVGQRLWQNIAETQKNPWNQPDMISSSHGQWMFGDHYMRNAAIWSLVCALAVHDKKAKQFCEQMQRDVSQLQASA